MSRCTSCTTENAYDANMPTKTHNNCCTLHYFTSKSLLAFYNYFNCYTFAINITTITTSLILLLCVDFVGMMPYCEMAYLTGGNLCFTIDVCARWASLNFLSYYSSFSLLDTLLLYGQFSWRRNLKWYVNLTILDLNIHYSQYLHETCTLTKI
jgi:hypothetical protein